MVQSPPEILVTSLRGDSLFSFHRLRMHFALSLALFHLTALSTACPEFIALLSDLGCWCPTSCFDLQGYIASTTRPCFHSVPALLLFALLLPLAISGLLPQNVHDSAAQRRLKRGCQERGLSCSAHRRLKNPGCMAGGGEGEEGEGGRGRVGVCDVLGARKHCVASGIGVWCHQVRWSRRWALATLAIGRAAGGSGRRGANTGNLSCRRRVRPQGPTE